MIIQSIKPTNISDLHIWYDFSDSSTINQGLGGATELGSISVISDKVNGTLLEEPGAVGPSYGTSPVYKTNAINGLGVAYFGSTPSHITNGMYSDILTTDWNVINDNQRTIFMVYKTLGMNSFGGTISTTNALNTTFAYSNILPGTFGCIMNISFQPEYYYDSTGTSSNWCDTGDVSFINLIKYKDGTHSYGGTTYSICNCLLSQGLPGIGGYPGNNINNNHKIYDNINTSNILTFRSLDNDSATYSSYYNSYSQVSSLSNDLFLKHAGTFVSSGSTNVNMGRLSLGSTGNYQYNAGFCGYIGEFIYYSRRLSDSETNQVKQYLTKKWGL